MYVPRPQIVIKRRGFSFFQNFIKKPYRVVLVGVKENDRKPKKLKILKGIRMVIDCANESEVLDALDEIKRKTRHSSDVIPIYNRTELMLLIEGKYL